MLIPIFLSKLSDSFKLILSREFDKNIWEIEKVLLAFRKELEAQEKVALNSSSSSESLYHQGSSNSSSSFLFSGKGPFDHSHLSAAAAVKNQSSACTLSLRKKEI